MSDADRGVIGGRYQIIASLGKGGMGQVYKAYDPILDRTVALKKMIATVVDSEEGRQRFYIEARAAARLNHPNIVTIHELEEYGGDIYIVMELLDGVSLAAFMKQRVDMPLAGYLTIIAQIGEGLHYAHKRAIVHRDIKPPNLVLTTSGNLKILDFGIARLASNEITKKGKLLGTPHYMAPEQVTEQAVDMRADLFSLGAVAYELVTGVKPFTADSIPALLMQITSTPHRPVLEVAPETEPALAAIIDRLLAKDRTARFGTGMELVAALDLIGEIDRIDFVADAVAAVMGPSGEATVYAPIGSTPLPGVPTPLPGMPTPSSAASPSPTPIEPPLFGVTPPATVRPSFSVTPSVDLTPPFGATPRGVTPISSVQGSAEDATLSLSAPARAPESAATPAAPASPAVPATVNPLATASPDDPTLVDLEALPKPEAPARRATLDTMIGAPSSSLPETPAASITPTPSHAASLPSVLPPLPSAAEASSVRVRSDIAAAPAVPAMPAAASPSIPASGASADAKPPAASPPFELPDAFAAVPPPLPGATAASGITPPLAVPAAPPAPVAAMPSHAAPLSNVPSSAAAASGDAKTPAASSPRLNIPPTGPADAAAAPSVPVASATADAKTPAAAAARGFVNAGVPQARHRSGAGAAVVVVGLLLLPAVVAIGWWGVNTVRGAFQSRTTATDTTSPSAVKDADPSTQKPAEPPSAATDQASQANQPNQAAENQPKPEETPAATSSPEPPPPAVDANANAATPTEKPSESEPPPPRPADANSTAVASQTSQPNPALPANQANASQNPASDASRPPQTNQTQAPEASRTTRANQSNASQLADARRPPQTAQAPAANQADANPGASSTNIATREPAREPVTDRTKETSPNTVVRDATRENTRRAATDTTPPAAENTRREPAPPVREEAPAEPAREPSTPADTRSLDYGSLSAFRGGSRSTGSASNVYSDSPSAAAAVARITYALEAYGDAIAARDLDALRDVRSPVTPAESTMLKEGRLTVRFSNLDVSLNGNDARVRCRRAVVANGKTLSSGPADVRLTRRPEGWVITDIR